MLHIAQPGTTRNDASSLFQFTRLLLTRNGDNNRQVPMPPKKILIVDDEQEICDLVQEGLRDAGYQVETATTGKEGLEKAVRQKPDLIILDLHLPDMDGVNLYQELKNTQEHRETPVVFLTGLAQGTEPQRGNLESRIPYSILPKPASVEEIEKEIRRLLAFRSSRA